MQYIYPYLGLQLSTVKEKGRKILANPEPYCPSADRFLSSRTRNCLLLGDFATNFSVHLLTYVFLPFVGDDEPWIF